jgi:hypothetical protein
MKAPRSKRAQKLLANDKVARKVVNAARTGKPTRVKTNGKTFIVKKAQAYTPKKNRNTK